MSLTRRYFLKTAAAAGAAAVTTGSTQAAQRAESSSPSEKLGVAIVGAGGRANDHLKSFSGRKDAEILYVCDVDEKMGQPKLKAVGERQGRTPRFVKDFREILDDPSVDVISTATPNHWHALVAILAMQADKHVYVEKPVSHNVWEGRQAANWARKLNKICQCGTQSRSSPSLAEAAKWLQAGHLGQIQYAVGTCYKARPSIGKLTSPLKIPDYVDYDLWCGPAAKLDLYRPKLHYDWHWDFNTGNGDMGNQGIHQMDIARWFLGEPALSPRVMSIGGRVGYDDAGDTPNTQIVYHAYEKAPLIFETRGLPRAKKERWNNNDMDNYRGSQIGVIVQCEKGYMVIPSYTSATAFDNDGREVQTWSGGGDHYANFIDAVRSGRHEDLNADIVEGHVSSALCHTGAISHLLGSTRTAEEIRQQVSGDPLLADSFERMASHLDANGVDISDPKLSVGPWLEMDPRTERFTNSEPANLLLTREYRKGFVVPDAGA